MVTLDGTLAALGRFPALDLTRSGTLRPELLVGEPGAEAIAKARTEATVVSGGDRRGVHRGARAAAPGRRRARARARARDDPRPRAPGGLRHDRLRALPLPLRHRPRGRDLDRLAGEPQGVHLALRAVHGRRRYLAGATPSACRREHRQELRALQAHRRRGPRRAARSARRGRSHRSRRRGREPATRRRSAGPGARGPICVSLAHLSRPTSFHAGAEHLPTHGSSRPWPGPARAYQRGW